MIWLVLGNNKGFELQTIFHVPKLAIVSDGELQAEWLLLATSLEKIMKICSDYHLIENLIGRFSKESAKVNLNQN